MNLTNGSANFFSEIESNLLLVSLSSISRRCSFPGQKVSLGTPGRSQVLVVWSSTLHRSVVLMIKEHWVLVKMWGVKLQKWICGHFRGERVTVMHRATISDNIRVEWVAIVHRTSMLHGGWIVPAGLSVSFDKSRCFWMTLVDTHDVLRYGLNIAECATRICAMFVCPTNVWHVTVWCS